MSKIKMRNIKKLTYMMSLSLVIVGISLFIHFAPVDFDAKVCGGGFKSWIFEKYKEQLVCEFVDEYDKKVNTDDVKIIKDTEEVTWDNRNITIAFGILAKNNSYRICFQGKRYWIEKYKWDKFVFVNDSNVENLQEIFLSRITSKRDEYIYFGKYADAYNPTHENDKRLFNKLKDKYNINNEQTNISIDVTDNELSDINPSFYYAQRIKQAGEKFQAEYKGIDLLDDNNRELLYRRMKCDINNINCPANLFVDCNAIYMRGIVIEQLNSAFSKDNSTECNNSISHSNILSY